MTAPITARRPHAPPTHHDADAASPTARPVVFRHPGYADAHNVLLSLPAVDGPTGGLHHETARIACAIVAGNRWDGFLTDAHGSRVDARPDDLLDAQSYYFHVPDSPEYPVVPTFREWTFPHNNLPPSWTVAASILQPERQQTGRALSSLSAALALRDGSCRMSACEEGCQVAHLIPQKEDAWFLANTMGLYAAQYRRVDAARESRNALLLRADLHAAFDQAKFAFVPKPLPSDEPWCPFAVHLLDPLALELRRLYHNVPLQLPLGVAPEFIFARFAWALFPMLETFLLQQVHRKLLMASRGDQPVTLPHEQCALLTRQGQRSRSVSPKKRSHQDAVAEPEDYQCPLNSKRPRKRRSSRQNAPPQSSPRSQTPDRASLPDDAADVAFDMNNSQTSASDATLSDEELDRLYHQHLQNERLRSDPHGSWFAEKEWLEEARMRPLGQEELRRFWEAQGYDILEDDWES